MKKNKILFVLILLITNVMFSQTGFDDDVEDVPAAPIDEWVVLGLAAVVLYGYKCTMISGKKA